jgi:carboxyl-terminal processing protease
MKAMKRLLAASLMITVACGSESTPPVTPATNTPTANAANAAAMAYLDSAITLMQNRAFYRRRVKWDSVRTVARLQAFGANTTSATYTAIRQALLSLGDRHSFLQPPLSSAPPADYATALGRVDSLHGEFLGGKYGFIHVPTFSGSVPGANPTSLADSLQSLIRLVDARDPCAWIVDLRHNRGGNMWPMLAGVGPILGNDDRVGHFVDADSVITTWYYTNGVAGTMNAAGQRFPASSTSRPAYVLRRPNPPVAVLTDSLTASSGEAITVAFRGLSRARSFGGATAGVPTANAGYRLSDGAMLFLMVALDSDRNGNWYSDRIRADEPIFISTYPATDDAVVTAAMKWLSTRGTCGS